MAQYAWKRPDKCFILSLYLPTNYLLMEWCWQLTLVEHLQITKCFYQHYLISLSQQPCEVVRTDGAIIFFIFHLFFFLQMSRLRSRVKWLAHSQRATGIIIANITENPNPVPDAVPSIPMNTFPSRDNSKIQGGGSDYPQFTDGEARGPDRSANLVIVVIIIYWALTVCQMPC